MEEYDVDEIKHAVEKGVPLFGPMGLNRQQRRALRKKLDTLHQKREKVRAASVAAPTKPKSKRKAKLKAALKFFGLSALVLQAFIYYDSIIRLVA